MCLILVVAILALASGAIAASPSPVPSPPPSCSNFLGTYRIQSDFCQDRYLAFAINCADSKVRLFTLQQAGEVKYRRTYWRLNARPESFTAVEAYRACSKNILASNLPPSLGTNSDTWQYELIPNGNCTTVNMQAKNGQGAGFFLGVNADCSDFEWKNLPDSFSAKWNLIKISNP